MFDSDRFYVNGNSRQYENIRKHFILIFEFHYLTVYTYQISERYIIIGASINPAPMPNNPNVKKITGNVSVWDNNSQANVFGKLTNNIVFCLPMASVINPLSRLPMGWPINMALAEILK